ncbi:ribonuclease H family protein [Lactobacillus hominis]|uniref:Ribonuclease H n=1 Tax=Lactobacillus hominis DSM 23910 = CRBIP 24.179 TaxID=1423758 RepID=I7KGQ2_9LACO|nr:ribonuclease H family protein [Lactobacillus hominis]KRM84759.1 ribonuclease h1 [Lactobacillus hominis DSM 23910 = CRBIP 24.179]MCT3347802.1 ribonuclease [Lactobacillus hominis]CCI81430.1 Ribonuclease H1 [Lactobacillus hominis DSM 23910 = CRBIP 24.179]
MKIYAVKKGRTPGIYRTWDEAKAQVDGFSGAEYKSFEKITDATTYLNWNKETQPNVVKEDTLQNAIDKIKKQANQQIVDNKKANNHSDFFATIYTDGGTRNTSTYKGGHVKPTDKAAWAYLIEWQDKRDYKAGGELGATNNKMEQTALIKALKRLIELDFNDKNLRFVLDSKYVLDAINKHWLTSWKKRGWKKSSGSLANVKQWQEIDELLTHFPHTQFDWTKGHANNRGNEFVDHELNKYMDKM